MRKPIEKFVLCNGARVCVFDWPALPQAQHSPALLFAHGASFHARVWDAVIDRLPNRCIALDLSGHGRSDAPATPLHWRIFAEDVIAAAEDAKAKPLIGIGHSLGGHAIAQAAALRPDLFDRLMLIDPVILPQGAYRQHSGEPDPTVRRRSAFASLDEMKEKLGARPPFSQWDPRVFDDYCRHGVLLKEDGSVALACAPATEAAIYAAGVAIDADISSVLTQITAPTTVLRTSRPQNDPRDFMASPTRPDLASLLPRGIDRIVEGSHFVPMEAPAKIAAWIEAFI
jgi:pimeloyl-ACP methyl ester carboxylesterase